MLSNVDILTAIKDGRFRLQPFDPAMIRPAGVTLRLGNRFYLQYEKGVIDPYDEGSMVGYKLRRITGKNPLVLAPNDFGLVTTYERVGISRGIGALVDGTSTMGRLGISVTQSASVIDTGHGWPAPRFVTLEVKNNGKNGVELHYKMKIGRMVLFNLQTESTVAYDERGKYRRGSILPRPLKKA